MPESSAPLFPSPFAPAFQSWTAIFPSFQALWNLWTFGYKVTSTDLQSIFRLPAVNYATIQTNRQLSGDTSLLPYPPVKPFFPRGIASGATAHIFASPALIYLENIRPPLFDSTWLVWATQPTAQVTDAPTFPARFIGYTTMPAASVIGTQSSNMAAQAAVNFPDLLTNTGWFTHVYVFGYSEGQAEYAGGWIVPIEP